MTKHLLKERFQELAGITPLKEGFRDPEDNYGFPEKPEYFDAFLYFEDLAEKKGIPLTISNFAQFLDKHTDSIPDSLLKVINVEPDENQIGLSPQSNEWLENQVNMYFGGANEPGGEAEFEITRIEQGDPQKYDDAHLAQKFLEELRELRNIVVRYDDYIGDIKVTSDREGDAIVTWTWPS